jgi:hypothetical protein
MKVIINGVKPYDGEYSLELSELTNGEYRRIKLMSGYTLAEYQDAIRRVDTDWITAIGAVAAARHHGLVEESIFWKAQTGSITVDFSDEDTGDVADPPTINAPETPSMPSGESSKNVSELPSVRSQAASGIPT